MKYNKKGDDMKRGRSNKISKERGGIKGASITTQDANGVVEGGKEKERHEREEKEEIGCEELSTDQ